MTDESYRGTGAELAVLDLGEYGEIRIEDDGDNDTYVTIYYQDPNGARADAAPGIKHLREQIGDTRVVEVLEEAVGEADDTEPDPDPPRRRGRFICAECARTWPAKYDQTPDTYDCVCPECHEDADD